MTSRWNDLVGAAHARPGTTADAVDGAVPAWVVRPGTVAEVQAVVGAAAGDRAALVASGLGAHLDLGAPPRRVDVLLRLDRLDGLLDHEAADMTVRVQAGCPLARLADVLATAAQWLPVDPPRPEATTVGGLLAAGLAGPLRASQGTARDLLLGLRWVDARGRIVASGGRVVKNVAGYDLHKLHVGALGSVGVIVEATLKVRPRPECEEAVVVACRSAAQAAELGLDLRDALDPLWLEVAGARALADGPGDAAALAVGIAGDRAEVAAWRAVVVSLVERAGLRALAVADGASLRARLGAFPAARVAAVLRAGVLPSDVGEVMTAIEAAGRERGTDVRCLAHGANGVVRASVADATAVGDLVAALRPRIEARGGWFGVERAVPAAKHGLDAWGAAAPLDLMRRVKAAFDPEGLLAPGRFVGGL